MKPNPEETEILVGISTLPGGAPACTLNPLGERRAWDLISRGYLNATNGVLRLSELGQAFVHGVRRPPVDTSTKLGVGEMKAPGL
jgi:hypothetical protein